MNPSMAGSLRERLHEMSSEFAAKIFDALRAASIDELIAHENARSGKREPEPRSGSAPSQNRASEGTAAPRANEVPAAQAYEPAAESAAVEMSAPDDGTADAFGSKGDTEPMP